MTQYQVASSGAIGGITWGPDGNIWVTESASNDIARVSPTGTVTGQFPVPTASAGFGGMSNGADGNLWFAETSADKIGRITTSGSVTEFRVPTASSEPHGIAEGPDGNDWFVEVTGNKVGRITPAGTITEFRVPTAAARPFYITTGPDGNLWFTEQATGKIGRITPGGVITEFPVPASPSNPAGITSGPDGNIWFADAGTNTIGRITTAGVVTEFKIPTAASDPDKITVGADGNLWFTEHTANKIGKLALSAAGGAPANTSAPSVSGADVSGQTVSAVTGSWSGSPSPTFTYSWLRCSAAGTSCVPIAGATSSTYTIQSADLGSTLAVGITATNSVATAWATSGASGVVSPPSPPVNTSLPSISGTPLQGDQLAASNGAWTGTPAPTFSYAWSDCGAGGGGCTAISGATSSTYVAQASDVGSTLEVTVTAANSAGSASATSAPTAVVTAPQSPPVNGQAPAISGSAVEAQIVTASTGTWTGTPAPTFSYRWSDCNAAGANCAAITGATSSTYTALSADVGSTLEVTVTAANSAGSASATSPPTAVVTSAPGPVTALLDAFNLANNSGPPDANWSRAPVVSTGTSNNLKIISDQVGGISGSNGDYWNPQTFGPNSEDWITAVKKPASSSDPVTLGLRFTNAGLATATGYQAYFFLPNKYQIIRRVNGTISATLATTSTGPTLAAGDHLLFRAIGSTLELWRESGSTWTRILSANDTTITGAGYLMLSERNTIARLDNFGGGTLP